MASMRAWRFVPLPEIKTVRRVFGGVVMVIMGEDGGVQRL